MADINFHLIDRGLVARNHGGKETDPNKPQLQIQSSHHKVLQLRRDCTLDDLFVKWHLMSPP